MIPFWKKDTGNLMSHVKGITAEQVKFFQSLKEGDRLIAWDNRVKDGESQPHYTLRVFKKQNTDNEF